jgi:hypothetical protein
MPRKATLKASNILSFYKAELTWELTLQKAFVSFEGELENPQEP